MKTSVFTASMPEYDIPGAIKVLSELGYDGIELKVVDKLPKEKPAGYTFATRYWSYNQCLLDVKEIDETIKDIKNLCDKNGIEICSLTSWFAPGQTEEIEMVMKAAAAIDCRNIRIAASNFDGKKNYNDIFNNIIEQTRGIEKLARRYKVRINFETHMNTIIPGASAAYRLVSNFDPELVGVIFDPGNMVIEGYENYDMGLDLLGQYLAHVHVKNAIWKFEKADEDGRAIWKDDWAPLDRGIANIEEFIRSLDRRNYKGYLSLEDFSNDEETYEKLKKAIGFLKKVTAKL